jgi:hypothetical protein
MVKIDRRVAVTENAPAPDVCPHLFGLIFT